MTLTDLRNQIVAAIQAGGNVDSVNDDPLPIDDPEATDEWVATVQIISQDEQPVQSRGDDHANRIVTMEVDVRKRIVLTNSVVDAAIERIQSVRGDVQSYSYAGWHITNTVQEPWYDRDIMREHSIFVSAPLFTFEELGG